MIRYNCENSKIPMKSLEKKLRWPGIEPGSNAWKASMLTITPPTLVRKSILKRIHFNPTTSLIGFIAKIKSHLKIINS